MAQAEVPTPVQRSVLLSAWLSTPEKPVLVTGIPALQLFKQPVGKEPHWVPAALKPPSTPFGLGTSTPRTRAHEPTTSHAPQRLVVQSTGVTFSAAEIIPHLAWTTTRVQHRGEDFRTTKSWGLPAFTGPWGSLIVHPVEALVETAPLLPHWQLVACVDALLSYEFEIVGTGSSGNFHMTDLALALNTLPPRAEGVLAVRRAMKDATFPVLSPMETVTRLLLLLHGAPMPATNLPVCVEDEDWCLDLAWEAVLVGVEYNGRDHADPELYRKERYRALCLRSAGWEVFEITKDDLAFPHRREKFLNALLTVLHQRGATQRRRPMAGETGPQAA